MMIMGNIMEFFFGLWTELRSRTHLTCESFHFSKELKNLTRSDAAQTNHLKENFSNYSIFMNGKFVSQMVWIELL